MPQDFSFWWRWYRQVNPRSSITEEQALEAYQKFYQCLCPGCEYRKSRGFMPIRLSEGCTAPMAGEILAELI